ncbi:hypothetical protein NEDG_01920 [Nematocida displodere]|uniref:Uncharacterized protein n=1 Tax=Nematocida displodere TaxID=1805483 RepID=A0A177EHG3_9MICR|nr:hypothetical protein NEDG_01920 [Nematocida displodere]
MANIKTIISIGTNLFSLRSLFFRYMTRAPEVLPRSIHTEASIKLWSAHRGNQLLTSGISPDIQIVKKQPETLLVYLPCLEMSAIPDLIEPGVVLTRVYIFSFVPGQTNLFIKDLCTKLLYALREVEIGILHMEAFGDSGATLPPARPPFTLAITDGLWLHSLSSPFIAWLCSSIDLGGCNKRIGLELVGGDVWSVACLDSLNIENPSGLCLKNLPNLANLECQVILKESCIERLELRNLPESLAVSFGIARAIRKKAWKIIDLDDHIWRKITGSPFCWDIGNPNHDGRA